MERHEHSVERVLDHPGVATRCTRTQRRSFDENDASSGLGHVRGGRHAHDPTTDDDDVGRGSPRLVRLHRRMMASRAPLLRLARTPLRLARTPLRPADAADAALVRERVARVVIVAVSTNDRAIGVGFTP